MFSCTLLNRHSSIANILMGKRELVALLYLSSWCLVMVERLFLAVLLGCLPFVIVVFPDHTHLLFLQMEILGRQIFGKQQVKYFIDTFQKANSQKYRCLLVDISPHSDPTYKQKNQHLTMPVNDSVSVRKGNRNQLIKKEKYFLRLLVTTTI